MTVPGQGESWLAGWFLWPLGRNTAGVQLTPGLLGPMCYPWSQHWGTSQTLEPPDHIFVMMKSMICHFLLNSGTCVAFLVGFGLGNESEYLDFHGIVMMGSAAGVYPADPLCQTKGQSHPSTPGGCACSDVVWLGQSLRAPSSI